MFTVSKTHRFEAAHRLVRGYVGNCAHLHGHSWEVRFIAEGENLSDQGMLRDFADFKPIRKWIDENLDHATLICADDWQLQDFLVKNNQRHFVMVHNPTSENLCKLLYAKCHELGLTDVVEIQIHETCTSKATYGPSS